MLAIIIFSSIYAILLFLCHKSKDARWAFVVPLIMFIGVIFVKWDDPKCSLIPLLAAIIVVCLMLSVAAFNMIGWMTEDKLGYPWPKPTMRIFGKIFLIIAGAIALVIIMIAISKLSTAIIGWPIPYSIDL